VWPAHARLFEDLLQFAGLKHFADNIATADELALDIEARHALTKLL